MIHRKFLDYYGDLTLKKIKVNDGWVIYCAKVNAQINEFRYLFVIVRDSMSLQDRMSLSNLNWVSFQTRTTNDYYSDVPSYNLFPTEPKKQILNDKLDLRDRSKVETLYSCKNTPINVKLIHEMRKNNIYQYPDTLFLYQALETYNCVVDLQ